ncbi:uncharacterized protein EI97DRAFT_495314 [Westerdykella ornata]|uniref:Transmembrane protein n=1 Tax=Westerdykella ornata TaxID=318751 RepID=A0A6A6JE73_WESOR|nr:uncharacterized protein EI97DRAFT_495314 [Westerdykella ornata]KAF2274565.1 hypothetical protein EI97DRAFT_495314 [Westerdykella ornata]
MASLQTIPRFLLPRGPSIPRARAFPVPILPISHLRHATILPPRPKKTEPRILGQPDKYRPPSHGTRLPRSETTQKTYGPPLSKEERERMRTKKYPNMMSPEGTFSHWFLHNRSIHLIITLGILFTLGGSAWYLTFKRNNPYNDLLPEPKEYMRHPITSLKRFFEVLRMYQEHLSEQAEAKRLKREDDIEKRMQFRLQRIREAEERGEEYLEDPRYWVDAYGVRRRRVKKWFGIWE